MKRKKPMKRSSFKRRPPAPSARKKSAYRSRERATDYMLGVKMLPCAARIVDGHACSGPIEADHAGPRGIGRKAHDSTVIPMCQLGHRERTDFSGPFKRFDQAMMRDFLYGRILQTQRLMRSYGYAIPGEVVEFTTAAPTFSGEVTVSIGGRAAVVGFERADDDAIASALAPVVNRLAEDIREEGNVDVRHPTAVIGEGDPR